jgi:hypothetical protein
MAMYGRNCRGCDCAERTAPWADRYFSQFRVRHNQFAKRMRQIDVYNPDTDAGSQSKI